jgi:divalent metal cation (Fe/Co/Zn/Cd) transporter
MKQSLSSTDKQAASAVRLRSVRFVLLLTLVLNLVVAVAKIAYGSLAEALTIRADGFHSLTDTANNVVGLTGIWLASRPADDDHPYGHEKFEVIAAHRRAQQAAARRLPGADGFRSRTGSGAT